MDEASFGAFQQQITRNQAELTDYLKDLDSWKETISQKDNKLRASSSSDNNNKEQPTQTNNYPPVRNSLHKKRKTKKKADQGLASTQKQKPARIPGHDFRAWDKFDVGQALEDIDNEPASGSSSEEETDEEWEDERMKQQAIFEKDQGNDHYKQNKFDEAVQCYTKGITCDPTNAVLYANRAMALLKQDKFGAVIQDCTDAISLDPTYVKAYMRRATARQKLQKYQSALSDYHKVLTLDPDNKAAKRETAVLSQELQISEHGLVIPIKKEVNKRSKKPYVRLEIEDIDHDDVKLKLNAAVARTTELQSEEKKRIVAQDEKLFSKYTSQSERTSDESYKSADKSYKSPADIIAKKLPAADVANNKRKVPASKPNKTESPQTSPRAPANSYQFQKDWKVVKDDLDKSYEYLKLIPASDFPKLIGEFLDANVLKSILGVLQSRFVRDGINVYKHMLSLTKVKRFAMIIMFMSSTDKQDARSITEHLSTQNMITDSEMDELTALYEL